MKNTDTSTESTGKQLRKPITESAAWRANELEDTSRWLVLLSGEEIAEIVKATRNAAENNFKIGEFGVDDFDVPLFAERAEDFRDRVENGVGFVVVRGVPVDLFDIETAKLMYWGLGAYIGEGISQNARGELVAEVTDRGLDKDKANVRGYVTKAGGSPHCDSCDAVSLFCYHPAKSGGESLLSSTLTVFNDILESHPEYLPILEEGFHMDLRGEGASGDPDETTNHKNPVFSYYEGRMSCRYNARSALRGALKRGQALSDEAEQALNYVRECALEPENLFKFTMERGDWSIFTNHMLLHTRSAFDDYDEPERKRRLFRIWFNLQNSRPLAPEIADRLNTGPRGGVKVREGAGYWSGPSEQLGDQVLPS
jgi:hypothetical protein